MGLWMLKLTRGGRGRVLERGGIIFQCRIRGMGHDTGAL